jgi:hypothetical protein
MRNKSLLLIVSAVVVAGVAYSGSTRMSAQAPARAGAFTAARTADGQPNLEGIWRAWNLAQYDLEDHGAKPGVPAGRGFVVDPPDGKIPYRPEMLDKRKKNYEGTKTFDPVKNTDPLAKCYIPGYPRITYMPWPFQIVQSKETVFFNYEWSHKTRYVPVTNIPAPKRAEPEELTWSGMPRGKFDGSSLVVTLTNFNPYSWFDMAGNFHSDALKVTERYTLVGPDTLQYEATMEDPKVFTRPWTIRMNLDRQKDTPLLDYECTAMLDDLGIDHTWERDFEVN